MAVQKIRRKTKTLTWDQRQAILARRKEEERRRRARRQKEGNREE